VRFLARRSLNDADTGLLYQLSFEYTIGGISEFRQVEAMRPARNLFGIAAAPRRPCNSPGRDADATGFASRLDLPLACEVLDGPPAEPLRDAVAQANAGNLAFLLHGVDAEAAPRAADEQLDEALAPIRTKLDIVIGMLARLSYRTVELPPCCYIELGERQIAWVAEHPLREGDWLRISIYFDATFREPVVIFGQATGSAALGPSGQYRNEAALAEIAEPIIGDLARLALLAQRRQRARRNTDTGARRAW